MYSHLFRQQCSETVRHISIRLALSFRVPVPLSCGQTFITYHFSPSMISGLLSHISFLFPHLPVSTLLRQTMPRSCQGVRMNPHFRSHPDLSWPTTHLGPRSHHPKTKSPRNNFYSTVCDLYELILHESRESVRARAVTACARTSKVIYHFLSVMLRKKYSDFNKKGSKGKSSSFTTTTGSVEIWNAQT